MVGAVFPTGSRNKPRYSLYDVFECLFRELFLETMRIALLATSSSFNLLRLQAIQILLLNLQPWGSLVLVTCCAAFRIPTVVLASSSPSPWVLGCLLFVLFWKLFVVITSAPWETGIFPRCLYLLFTYTVSKTSSFLAWIWVQSSSCIFADLDLQSNSCLGTQDKELYLGQDFNFRECQKYRFCQCHLDYASGNCKCFFNRKCKSHWSVPSLYTICGRNGIKPLCDQCWEEVVLNGLQKLCLICVESFRWDLKSIKFEFVWQAVCFLIQKYVAAN